MVKTLIYIHETQTARHKLTAIDDVSHTNRCKSFILLCDGIHCCVNDTILNIHLLCTLYPSSRLTELLLPQHKVPRELKICQCIRLFQFLRTDFRNNFCCLSFFTASGKRNNRYQSTLHSKDVRQTHLLMLQRKKNEA